MRKEVRSVKTVAIAATLDTRGDEIQYLQRVQVQSSTSPGAITVTVSPATVNTLWPSLAGAPPQTQKFTATVTNTTNTAVTWAVSGGSAYGTIDQTGLYTAPSAVPAGPVTVTATSQADTTKSGNATVDIQTPTKAGAYTVTVSATEGSIVSQPTTLILTVN